MQIICAVYDTRNNHELVAHLLLKLTEERVHRYRTWKEQFEAWGKENPNLKAVCFDDRADGPLLYLPRVLEDLLPTSSTELHIINQTTSLFPEKEYEGGHTSRAFVDARGIVWDTAHYMSVRIPWATLIVP